MMKQKKSCLKCPVCGNELYAIEKARLYKCDDKHSFDMAKEGYVNLLLSHEKKSKNPGDSQEMVVSRQSFLSKGFYEPISDEINSTVKTYFKSVKKHPDCFLDLGCGEGYYLKRLIQNLDQAKTEYFGLDISKSAIKLASRHDKTAHWIVANSFFTPFSDQSLSGILSVFSPIDMGECKRMLEKEGVLVRVFPETNHLMQLKEVIYPEIKVKEYEQYLNDLEGLEVISVKNVAYDITLQNEDLVQLLLMTPHFWRVKEENKKALLNMDTIVVTVSVSIGVYKQAERALIMAGKKSNRKGSKKHETLFSRWKSDPYKIIIEKIIEKRFISKKTPLFEEKYDLRAANLRKKELLKVSLKGACLNQLCGYQLKLDHCDLSNVRIEMGDFEEAILTNTNLSESHLSKCIFRKAELDHITFENSTLIECVFERAQINNINVNNAILENCNFSDIINISEVAFLGVPKEVKNIQIDIEQLKESPFKTYLLTL